MKPTTALSFILYLSTISFLFAQERDIHIEKPTGRKIAILIGINDYEKIGKLECAKSDVELLRDSLYKIGFEKENVHCLVCGGNSEERPNRENIEETIDTVLKQTRRDDLIFLAMSGHGIQLEKWQILGSNLNEMAKNDSTNVQPRFCPIDTNNASVEKLLETTISIREIYEKVAGSQATYKLMLIDACRNAPTERSTRGKSASLVLAKTIETLPPPPKGIALFQSCGEGQKSYEDPEFKRGIFIYYFTEGISGKAIDPMDGCVTLFGLAKYAAGNTSRRIKVLQEMGLLDNKNAKQVPFLSGETADIVLASTFKMSNPTGLSAAQMPKPESSRPMLSGTNERKAGERMVLTIKEVEYAFRWCPPGAFKMGSPQGENGRGTDEALHQVKLTRGFWMLETEVTQEMWESVTGTNPSNNLKDAKRPVEGIGWELCQDFIGKLNEIQEEPKGYRFSMPTEAQWEYACRAGTTTPYPFEDMEAFSHYRSIVDVGSLPPNAWGLHDMNGNVAEWCSDWYGDYPVTSVIDPQGPSKGTRRVFRGANSIPGYSNQGYCCRSAKRNKYESSYITYYCHFGLRLALALTDDKVDE